MEIAENQEKLLTKIDQEYNLLDFPKMPLKDVEGNFKLIDRATRNILVEYLKLDSYELVKNLAKITNDSNAANIIAYRDGALGRNEALISRLMSFKTIENYKDRIEGEEKNKGAAKA